MFMVKTLSVNSSSSTKDYKKTEILQKFTDSKGTIRIIVSTIAFGMGLDAPNVRTVIHWGPSDSVESYVQESGRGGRDGLPSFATLYYANREVSKVATVTDNMRLYCGNTGFCRRKLLMRVFDNDATVDCPSSLHECCDVCEKECYCTECVPDVTLSEYEMENFE